jgi:phosphoenolpyruvate carboxykinase (ATP)
VPLNVEGLPKRLLDPRASWTDAGAYDVAAASLARMFEGNMRRFERPAMAAE